MSCLTTRTSRRAALTALPALALMVASAVTAAAQQSLPGYSAADAARERAAETAAIARPTPAEASAQSHALSIQAHVAGTPAQAETRDYVIAQLKQWGLPTEVRSYIVWLPHATGVHVYRTGPNPMELQLAEDPVPGDSTSLLPQYPTVNGTSGVGDVTAPVVYVNYGLIEDYAALDSMGISVKGKVAIARYGRSFRGIKAREAEKHGAVALLIYSDPQDDGYVRGDVYPEGPMRPPQGVQRGSVFNGEGDPSTPGYPSVPGAKRIPVSEMDIPHIPVAPISYRSATELLRDVRGADLPAPGWQGGLPFRYHVGPGPITARVVVTDDRATTAYKTIWDAFGIVRGSEFPDELVVIGGHRDAWGPGAADNVSGTVSVLQAAHAVADALRTGWRPRRTIVFASWDAEEWGLVGSTEYVEQDTARLLKGGVAYLNQDEVVTGPHFGAGGSPSLRAMLRGVAAMVLDPSGKGTVYQVWRRESGVPDSLQPAMGDPGGGSDFAGFYNHLGLPITEWGFAGPYGQYHSQYDSYHWMSKFGDPTFAYHATVGRIGAAMVMRLADADILPYDYVEYARTMRRYLPAIDRQLVARHWSSTTAPIAQAIDRLETAATAFSATRDSALAGPALPAVVRQRTNAALLQVERSLTRPQGLRTRPWYRNLIYAADENNGYANIVFPSVNEAIRAGDEALTGREIADLAARFDAAARALDSARDALVRRR